MFAPDWLQTDAEDFKWIKLPPNVRGAARLPRQQRAGRRRSAGPACCSKARTAAAAESADWDEAHGLARVAEVILAGGLDRRQRRGRHPLRAALGRRRVERRGARRGEKDPAMIREFVARVRAIEGL